MLKRKLIRSGQHTMLAEAILGQSATGLVGAGTTIANALVLTDDTDIAVFATAAAGTGAQLPAMEVGDEVTVANFGANALLVYPKIATEIINALAPGAGFSTAAGKSVWIKKVGPINYIALLGA